MRRAREMRRMSQRQVGLAMGTGQSSISDYEKGAAVPHMDTLERWADAVGFVVNVSFMPVELVDEDAYPWQAKVVYKAPTFGSGPVEEKEEP
jgi:transcriptional regulator with XRE-family HTH domain